MKSRILVFALALALFLPATACTNMNTTQQGALSAGVVGAGAGLGISALTGGNLGVGAAIGGVVGAVAGGIYGHNQPQYRRR